MNSSNADIMLEKVRKLFAQADDQDGTPEAEAFRAKAYELIARYGVDETQARAQRGDGPAPIIIKDITFTGKYQGHQWTLYTMIAAALHCTLVRITTNGEHRYVIAGTEHHIIRASLLFNLLVMQMLYGAAKSYPRDPSIQTASHRRSWMQGFIRAVKTRLTDAEETATEAAAPGTGLILVADQKRATAALRQQFSRTIKSIRGRSQYDHNGLQAGKTAGEKANLGVDNALHGGQLALTN